MHFFNTANTSFPVSYIPISCYQDNSDPSPMQYLFLDVYNKFIFCFSLTQHKKYSLLFPGLMR